MGSAKMILSSVGVGFLLLGLVGFCVLAGSLDAVNRPAAMLAGSVCRTSGSLPDLSDAAAANARTVTATALNRGGRRAALIALMTGLTESGLRVLANPNDPAGNLYPHQGVGYDHESLGIFQQRPSWGSAAQRMDPVVSTNLFLDRLLSLPGWRSLAPWQAAQDVQASAFADGSNYRQHLGRAAVLLRHITHNAASAGCGGAGVGKPPARRRGAHGLPVDYRLPATTSAGAAEAVSFALAQLGKPYVWGAEGPDSYDCSGLMQAAWSSAGVALSRTTYTGPRWPPGNAGQHVTGRPRLHPGF